MFTQIYSVRGLHIWSCQENKSDRRGALKPLSQARESSLVPLFIQFSFCRKRRFFKSMLLTSIKDYNSFNPLPPKNCKSESFDVNYMLTETLLYLSLNQVKWKQVPFCKFNTHNWHMTQLGLMYYIVMKLVKLHFSSYEQPDISY